jgi:hypothetical protein
MVLTPDPRVLQPALDRLVAELAHIGLVLKPAKCCVAARGVALARALAHPLALAQPDGTSTPVRVVDLDTGTVDVLGVPIGESGGVLASLERQLEEGGDADTLLSHWHTQLAWAAVRLCVLTRFNHVLRARTFPGAATALRRFDDVVAEALLASVAITAPHQPHIRQLLEARIGVGGMGMRGLAAIAGHARVAALVAHVTGGAPGLRSIVHEAVQANLQPVAEAAAQLQRLAITFAPDSTGALKARRDGRPLDAGGLQHRLTREGEVPINASAWPPAVAVMLQQRDGARCDALSQPPTPRTLVSKMAWTLQVSATLGGNPLRHIEAVVGSACPACHATMQPNHWAICKLASGEIVSRHNAVAREMAAYCNSGGNGALVRLERVVPHPSGVSGRTQRPDITVTGFASDGRIHNVHADVLVVDLLGSTALPAARVGLALLRAEASKRRQRDPAAQADGARFVPIVASSHGHLGSETYDLMRLMRGDRTDAEVAWWRRAIVAAVWRGTGRIVAKYLTRLGPLLPSQGTTVPDIPAEV